jgi:hypothetical protein
MTDVGASGCACGTRKPIFRSLKRAGFLFLKPLGSAQAEPQDGQTKRAIAGLNRGNFIAIISRRNWQSEQISISKEFSGLNIKSHLPIGAICHARIATRDLENRSRIVLKSEKFFETSPVTGQTFSLVIANRGCLVFGWAVDQWTGPRHRLEIIRQLDALDTLPAPWCVCPRPSSRARRRA